MELKPIIEIENLHFSYKKIEILNGIDLLINRGDVISLLGINGCGKSTLIKLILKLLHPKNGNILIESKNIKKLSHSQIASKVAYIPQHNSTPFGYSVLEMVAMARVAKQSLFAIASKQDYDIALESLEKIGIADLKDRTFTTLSGGQKQMVLLARALASEANILIMDEPVSGLDYGNQLRLLSLIKKLSDDGYTILKTSHYPDHAMLVSNRIIIMDSGKIIADGDSGDIITKALLSDLYKIKADIIFYNGFNRCLPNI